MPVQVDVYVMVHNEAQMLPYFLRHYGSFARRIFAFEDQSTDGSREILMQQPNVTIIDPAKHGIDEAYWTTKLWTLYEKYSRGVADYVMLVDADEFIYHPDILGLLEREKQKGHQLLLCHGQVMLSDHFPTGDGQIYDEIKTGLRCTLSRKWVVFDPAIYIRYRNGLHQIHDIQPGVEGSKPGLKLLHYRMLGVEHIQAHDRLVQARLDVYSGVTDRPYNPNWVRRLPDGTRGNMLEWYATHKDQAVDVVSG